MSSNLGSCSGIDPASCVDVMLQTKRVGGSHAIPLKGLQENNIDFISMIEGDEIDF